MPRVTIRAAHAADLAPLAALWNELDAYHASLQPAFFREGAPREEELAALLDDAYALVIVAERGGEVVGGISGRVFDTPDDEGMTRCRRLYADRLVVVAGERGRGLGRRLMSALEREGRAQGAEQLVLTVWAGNERARRFYQKEGLVEVGRILARELR